MSELIPWLLIPLAAWLGWRLSVQATRRGARRRARQFSDQYFQGLNYLLNEQPDKAIQVFVELADVNPDTVETHLALGSLFRRRGEVDRAIRIHQNIMAKSSLSDEQRTQALLELGEDYMRAGLLDRAERLFNELIERDAHVPSALEHLLDIYQQERDWHRSLEIAQLLEKATGERMGKVMAQFCCELAAQSIEAGELEAARKHLRGARRHDPQGIRARLQMATILERQQQPEAALDLLEEVADLDASAIPVILERYLELAERCEAVERAERQLEAWGKAYDGVSLLLARTARIERDQGVDAAADHLSAALAKRPSVRGLDRLIELKLNGAAAAGTSDEILRAVASRLLARQPAFRCVHCGFGGHTHHWQCPSCKRWATTRPIRGVLGE